MGLHFTLHLLGNISVFFWHLVSDLQLRNFQLHVVIGQKHGIIACTILLGILSAP